MQEIFYVIQFNGKISLFHKHNKYSFCSKGGAGGDRNSCSMSTKTLDMKSKWINDLTVAM